MRFLELAKSRHSVRTFKADPVEQDKILQVLEAARLAPSAVNFQPLHFIVITDEAIKNEIIEAYSRPWIKQAPVIIVACGDHSRSWKRKDGKDHCDIDVAIAVDHLTLAAIELGLGTCWVCAFEADKVHDCLELPNHLEAVALIPLGYPDEERVAERKRKELSEIVSWNRYENK